MPFDFEVTENYKNMILPLLLFVGLKSLVINNTKIAIHCVDTLQSTVCTAESKTNIVCCQM